MCQLPIQEAIGDKQSPIKPTATCQFVNCLLLFALYQLHVENLAQNFAVYLYTNFLLA
jgi:hypothetical protein